MLLCLEPGALIKQDANQDKSDHTFNVITA